MTTSVAYVRGIIPDAQNRHPEDFYPTPPQGTEALMAVERFVGPIWECACGDGCMSRVLARHNAVVSTDLVDRGYGESGVDFLAQTTPRAPNIVTNPPFKHAQKFAEKALGLTTGKVALLCRLAWLEGIGRKALFESTPLARVWIFARRLPIQRGRLASAEDGTGMIAFAWFVWEHGYTGAPTVGWLDTAALPAPAALLGGVFG